MLVRRHPTEPHLRLWLAQAEADAKQAWAAIDALEAAAAFSEAVRRGERAAEPLHDSAVADFHAGNAEKAWEALKAGLSEHPLDERPRTSSNGSASSALPAHSPSMLRALRARTILAVMKRTSGPLRPDRGAARP